jgi:hypothetical protein
MIERLIDWLVKVTLFHGVRLPEPEPEPDPEYDFFMYVDFPDGTVRRCRATYDPVWGYPTTPGLSSPEWEVVP